MQNNLFRILMRALGGCGAVLALLLAVGSNAASGATDGGAAPTVHIHRLHQPAVPGAWVSLDVEHVELTVAGGRRVFDVPVLVGVDPAAVGLEEVNARLRQACLGGETVESMLATASRGDASGPQQCHFTVEVNHGPWLLLTVVEDDLGAYPSINVTHVRQRLDTHATWSLWDGLAPERRAAFVAGCSQLLKAARKGHQASVEAAVWEDTRAAWGQEQPQAFTGGCTEAWLRTVDFMRSPNGDLVLHVGQFPHVVQALEYEVVIPAKLLGRAAAVDGPFAAARGATLPR